MTISTDDYLRCTASAEPTITEELQLRQAFLIRTLASCLIARYHELWNVSLSEIASS